MLSKIAFGHRIIIPVLIIAMGLGVCSSYAGDSTPKCDLPEEILSLKENDRTDPPRTIIDFDSTLSFIADSAKAVVWLKFKADSKGGMESIKVVFSSHSDLGLEKRAIEALEVGGFALPELSGHEKYKWLYHEVIFDRELFRRLMDSVKNSPIDPNSLEYSDSDDSLAEDTVSENFPGSDEFVALEVYPEMIEYGWPEYPREAKRAGLTGTVWVKGLIDFLGRVRQVMVGKTSGHRLLDNAAVISGYKCKFKPGYENGKPVACWATWRIDFMLEY